MLGSTAVVVLLQSSQEYNLSLTLSAGSTLTAAPTSIFNRGITLAAGSTLAARTTALNLSVTLAAVGALATSRVSMFSRSVTLAGGASLNAFRTSIKNVALTLTGAATVAQTVTFTQIAESDVVGVVFGVNTPVPTMGAITAAPEVAEITMTTPTSAAGTGQIVRFRILRIRPRVSLQVRVTSDGQAP